MVFPSITPDPVRRREEGIITELIDDDFRRDNRESDTVTKRNRKKPVHQVDLESVERPKRRVKNEIAPVLHPNMTALKENNAE